METRKKRRSGIGRRLLAFVMAVVLCVGMLPALPAEAANSIWQDVVWSKAHPSAGLHTPIYNDDQISYFQLDQEAWPEYYDQYHGATATCTCGATATIPGPGQFGTLDPIFAHGYTDDDPTTCKDCGYKPMYTVTIKNTLAEGVTAPEGFKTEIVKDPAPRGSRYTAYAERYEGYRATKTSYDDPSGTLYENITVTYEYSYVDPCSSGGNHDRKYVSTDDTHHKYYCTKCNEIFADNITCDHLGECERSETKCEWKCSVCGNYKKYEQHDFESYTTTPDPELGKEAVTFYICKNCGYEKTDNCTHEHTTKGYDNEKHWEICDNCGLKINEAAHGTDNWGYTRTQHFKKCSCGWTSPDTADHSKVYGRVSDTLHNFRCQICQYDADEGHEYEGTAFSGKDNCESKCTLCGELCIRNNHNFNKYRKGTNGKHFRICSFCGYEEEENCTYDDYTPAAGQTHYKVCSKCKGHGDTEACSVKCKNTAGDYHKVYCEKCKQVFELRQPCSIEYSGSTDTEHVYHCTANCGNNKSGNHRYGSKTVNTNYQYDLKEVGGKLITVASWEVVKYCVDCGYPKHVSYGHSGEGGSGGGKENRNFDGGAVAVAKPADNTFNNVIGLDLNANVTSDIDQIVADQYLDLVGQDVCDIPTAIDAAFGTETDEKDVQVVVEPKVTVTPTEYKGSSKTLSVEINATYDIYIQKGEDKVAVDRNKKIDVNESVHLSVPLPDGFGSEGKKVNIEHKHGDDTYTYTGTIVKSGNHYYLEFDSEHGFSPFTFELDEEQGENDVAGVTYRYYADANAIDNQVSEYVTAYFDDLGNAFRASSELNFKDQLPAGVSENASYAAPVIKLLKDVNVENELTLSANVAGGPYLDLNGKTLTVTETGALTGDAEVSLASTTPGIINSAGTIELPINMWTADTVNITAGTVTKLSVDGGTLNISGGEVDFDRRMINNGGAADIVATISRDARIRNLSYIVYLDEDGNIQNGCHNIMLNLIGGYYDVDPVTYKTRQTGGDPYDQSAYVSYDDSKVEKYSETVMQNDWNADPTIYRYRIPAPPCTHENKETRNAVAETCTTDGYSGDVYCTDCGVKLADGKAIPAAHDYEISYSWSDDCKSCTGTAVCKRAACAEDAEGHKVSEEATVTSTVKTQPTKTAKGVTTYTAVFTKAPFVNQTKDAEDIPQLPADPEEKDKTYVSGNSAMSPVPEITADTTELHLVKGQKFELPDKKGWTSADKKTVNISKKGVLTAKKVTEEGKPVVISKEGRKPISVYVTEPKLNKNKTKLEAGVSENLILSYDREYLGVLWESSAPDVATVSQNGNITAVSKGSAKITAHINGKSYTCKVTVTEKTAAVSRVIHLNVGKTKAISLKKLGKLKWTSSDENIAKMLTQKKVKAITEGTAILTATDEKTKQVYNIKLIVDNPEINAGKITLKKKTTYNLSMKVGETVPVDFKSMDIQPVFKSNKAAKAFDDGKGGIRAIAAGKAKLTATVNKTKITINVTVE